MEFRLLDASHRAHLERFECVHPDRATAPAFFAQDLIRTQLPVALASGRGHSAVGLWDGPVLVAVAGWRPDIFRPDDAWHITVLGVDPNYQDGTGNGYKTKCEVIRLAREANMKAITSLVSSWNGAMIRLNDRLGATRVPYPGNKPDDPDPHWYYTYVL